METETLAVRVRLAAGEERARLWREMAAIFPNYLYYQRKTKREVPIFVLELR